MRLRWQRDGYFSSTVVVPHVGAVRAAKGKRGWYLLIGPKRTTFRDIEAQHEMEEFVEARWRDGTLIAFAACKFETTQESTTTNDLVGHYHPRTGNRIAVL